ncbi:MAG TPA: hypothetical protein PK191_05640 [Niabella sp.]|nr:hypothetical protein [Niabella sp.]HOZ95989.1 hypothetical protein [Niabella sp.]HQW15516.1 hypothetical protein [Niabella sp.]HQX20658.1 hypothetical protein [Niabella sp.]HQX40534.1 hypothetical protein [Niabella sp.]
MNYKFFTSIVFLLSIIYTPVWGQQAFQKKGVYEAMESSKISIIDAQIKKVQSSSLDEKTAYEGALLMRKAGLVAVPAKKLSFFKQGHKMLESAIAANRANLEYRFLRLMIQENAPKSLGYYKSQTEDSRLIATGYKSLSSTLKSQILDYSKKSKSLPSSAL